MEEDLILQQPADRRLGNASALPPGPPGAEFDTVDFDSKNAPPKAPEKEITSSKSSRRRSPSGSPKRKPRGQRSPSPVRRRRSPTPPPPRRNRFRDYSPDRRRYERGRRSPDRGRRTPPRERRRDGRDRYRGRSSSRSRSPTPPMRRNAGGSRWSPKKKPNSPTPNVLSGAQQPPSTTAAAQAPAQYGVLPPQLYGDTYVNAAYNQYSVPPPQQQGFSSQADAYGMPTAVAPNFNAAYPPPPTWGVNDAYAQQTWLQQPDANQLQQMQPTPTPVAVQVQAPVTPTAAVQKTTVILPDAAPGTVDPNPAHDAIAQEAENQRDELKKQRSSYLKKTAVLKKELKMLKEQRKDLNAGAAPPSPTTKGFIDENEKLQAQIQKKLSTIENVIDMLTGIIGEENIEKEPDDSSEPELKASITAAAKLNVTGATAAIVTGAKQRSSGGAAKKKRSSTSTSAESSTDSTSSTSSSTTSSSSDDDDSSPERLKTKVIESMKSKQKELKKETTAAKEKVLDEKKRFNYVFYDPEMHWCQTCDIFPKTAKDYLNHLHSKEHMDRESIDTPWHLDMINDQYPTYENAPTKRTPIRGLTFFVPATAWFCKLCCVWMGDLHCASTHLKSQLHSNKYNAFLEKNQNFEVNWLADRQRVLNEKKAVPMPPQITSVSTTEHATSSSSTNNKKAKKDEEKSGKKRKKKSSDKKDKKKKKKRSKKRKKAAATSTSTSSESTSSDSESAAKKQAKAPIVIKELDNPNPAASIRVAMRKQESTKTDEEIPASAPIINVTREQAPPHASSTPGRIGKWTVAQESHKLAANAAAPTTAAVTTTPQNVINNEEENKRDDAIIQQWNVVQPVISESEKKLLEQLKGKLKNKPREEAPPVHNNTTSTGNFATARNAAAVADDSKDRHRGNSRRDAVDTERSRQTRYSRSRSRGRRTRTRSRGRDYRRAMRRSRSRGRNSPGGWRRRRSRSMRRRSRSFDRRRRMSSRSRTRSRSRSGSRGRIEKAVIKHSEFRPRVPEKEKDKKSSDNKDKRDASKKSKSSSSSSATASASNSSKKLPFIGKMPVFKKQSGQPDGVGEKRADEGVTYLTDVNGANVATSVFTATATQQQQQQQLRPPAPTAAQIQMAMMEDVYGNAPPFHPDAGMIMDYDDLMPDPVQYVNLMGQAPPPPPPTADGQAVNKDESGEADDADMLPPGIDEIESEEFVPKPLSDTSMPRKGPLPKDFEEALNIIFPGEKLPGDLEDEAREAEKQAKLASGETQIITDEPVMQAEDLVKEGIHMVTIEETSMAGIDEASQLSMNEPLVFNKPVSAAPSTPVAEDVSSQNANDIDLNSIEPPPLPDNPNHGNSNGIHEQEQAIATTTTTTVVTEAIVLPDDIPMPAAEKEDVTSAVVYDLDDIPQPPASPTESEKMRRQEELDDLAMLGIDADDMAAQCI